LSNIFIKIAQAINTEKIKDLELKLENSDKEMINQLNEINKIKRLYNDL